MADTGPLPARTLSGASGGSNQFLRRRSGMSSRTANSSGLVETLQASMDVEDAIKQSAEMSTALARDSSAVHAVPKAELQGSFKSVASLPSKDSGGASRRKLLQSNSLAAARARYLQELEEKANQEAAEAALRAEAEAKATEEASKSANSSRAASRLSKARRRPGSVEEGKNAPTTPAPLDQVPSSTTRSTSIPGTTGAGNTRHSEVLKDPEEVEQDKLVTEGSYTDRIELYGLTGERVMRYELVGVGREKVAQLRSLFISLDEDGGDELGPVELYEALIKFGQNVTDKQVREMMDEVDTDHSGTIGFEEFLMLAVPGASSGGPQVKREFSIIQYDSASFEDTDGHRGGNHRIKELQMRPVEIPIQCFNHYHSEADFLPRPKSEAFGTANIEGEQSSVAEDENPGNLAVPLKNRSTKIMLEMRLRFKLDKNKRVTLAASKGNIENDLDVITNRWTPKKYLYSNKELAPRDGKGAGIVFTAPEGSETQKFPGPPRNKCLCVQFPGKKKEVKLFEGCPPLHGFPILQITKQKLRIKFEVPFGDSFKSLSHLADFPPPAEFVSILSSGSGSSLDSLKRIVADESFLPRWYPFTFSTMCPDEEGKPRRIDLKEDLGELENLSEGNVCLDVYLKRDDTAKSLLQHESSQFSWVGDMESVDYQPSTNMITEIAFRGGSVNLNEVAKPLSLGVAMTEQVSQKSWNNNRGWISCPPHPHVMPLILSVNANIFLFPHMSGVTGDLIADILNASLLNEVQKKIIFIKLGLQVSCAVEHMHSHDIWHLDLKPSNLIVNIIDADANKPRIWQQVHVRVCDFSRCASHIFSNVTRRGTPGYWSPEQVHNRVDPLEQLRADSYWGLKESKDPPPTSLADVTEKSDSWGWATMMLGLMGRLDEMRKKGYKAFLQNLLDEGFCADLSAIFLFEQQAFINLLQSELDGINKMYENLKKAWTKLSENVERHQMDLDPLWQTATKSLQNLDDKDLNQLKQHRRAPPAIKLLTEAIGAILEVERKAIANWPDFKEVVISMEFVSRILTFDHIKGLSIQASKDLSKVFRNPQFQAEMYTEANVPNSDPTSPGSALAAATALFQWVVAVNEFNLLRRTTGPITVEMKQRSDEMKKLDPKITKLEERIAQQTEELNVLKQRLNENNREVLAIVRKEEKDEALRRIKDILKMDGFLTNQQFNQLQKDCLYATGEHANVFRLLAWLNSLPSDSTIRLGQPEGTVTRVFDRATPSVVAASVKTVMDDLYEKFACLRATRPKEDDTFRDATSKTSTNDALFSRVGSGVSDFGRSASQFHRAPSASSLVRSQSGYSAIEEEDEDDLKCNHFPTTGNGVHYIYEKGGDSLPPQHDRHEMLGLHSTANGVGDGLALVLAWCLQLQPIDRLPMPAVSAILNQLSPGQEWLYKGTVAGKAGSDKPYIDNTEWAKNACEIAPKLAAVMVGDRNDVDTELCLLERKAAHAYAGRNFMKASHFYMDLITKIESLSDLRSHWMRLCKAKTAMSKTRLRLGSVIEADEWIQDALSLLLEHQVEDPADSSNCSDVFIRYHPAQGIEKKEKRSFANESTGNRQELIQQRLVWAEVKSQEAAVLVSKATDQGQNVYYRAFEILHRTATVLQEVMGPESSKVSAVLQCMGEIQALRGRFHDALEIYKRALRIETRATGYDAYVAHSRVADMLYSLAKINMVLGKHDKAIGLLQRAIHIYSSIDSRGPQHPKVPELKQQLGFAFQGCLRYGEASHSFQDAFDSSSSRIVLHDRLGSHPLTHAEDLKQQGSLALILGHHNLSLRAYMKALSVYQTELKGMNWFGDKLEDNSEIAVAECLLGAGAAQYAIGNYWKALEFYQDAYQNILNRTKDDQNLALADICERMATCYIAMDKHGIALEWLSRALTVREFCQGRSHVDVAHTLTRISAVFRSIGQHNVAQSFTVRSLHMYVGVLERNHLCVAEALENLAVCMFPIGAKDYNNHLRKQSSLKLRVQSAIARVERCKARAELKREALVKLKKTPGIKKIALKGAEDSLQMARNEVLNAEADQSLVEGQLELREIKVKKSKDHCEECVAMVQEAVSIVKEILPNPCQKLTNLKKGSKRMTEMLHSMLSSADVHALKNHNEAPSPPSPLSSGLGGGSILGEDRVGRTLSTGTVRSNGTAMDPIDETDDLAAVNNSKLSNLGLGTNPLVEPSTPRSTQLPRL